MSGQAQLCASAEHLENTLTQSPPPGPPSGCPENRGAAPGTGREPGVGGRRGGLTVTLWPPASPPGRSGVPPAGVGRALATYPCCGQGGGGGRRTGSVEVKMGSCGAGGGDTSPPWTHSQCPGPGPLASASGFRDACGCRPTRRPVSLLADSSPGEGGFPLRSGSRRAEGCQAGGGSDQDGGAGAG